MTSNDLLKLISDLVSFKTVFPDKDEFTKCIKYIKDFFQSSGLSIKEFEFNKSRSLVISNHKSTASDVIFCGHIDVVPAEEDLFTVKKNGDTLYGRGVSDMKGQVAVMMQVMRKLSQQHSGKKVALFLTSDEERGGFDGVNKLINNESYSGKVAIVPDGGFNYSLVTEAKGVIQIKVTANGIGCHSSEMWNGENAILKLFNIFNCVASKFPPPKNEQDWKTSFNLAKIEGGDAINKVPSSASMYIDIRHIYDDKVETIIDYIKNTDESLEIEVLAHGTIFHIDENNSYIKKYLEVCESLLQKKISPAKFQGASDGRFFTQKNIPCIIMNPIGGNAHCIDEWVSLESLKTLKDIYTEYLKVI